MPNLTLVAEGDLPTGEHWLLKVGGTADDYYTLVETVHVDGHRDEGGMGGPLLHSGQYLNIYTGGSDEGLRRLIVRSDSQVQRLRVELDTGERLELRPVATDSTTELTFFVALLPWAVCPLTVEGLDHDGHVLAASRLRNVARPPRNGH